VNAATAPGAAASMCSWNAPGSARSLRRFRGVLIRGRARRRRAGAAAATGGSARYETIDSVAASTISPTTSGRPSSPAQAARSDAQRTGSKPANSGGGMKSTSPSPEIRLPMAKAAR